MAIIPSGCDLPGVDDDGTPLRGYLEEITTGEAEEAIMDSLELKAFALSWIEDWNSHDLERILSHYADDFEMSSPRIPLVTGEASGRLVGKDRIGAYWGRALELSPTLHFTYVAAFSGVGNAIVVYERQDGRRAAEMFEFRNDSKVYRSAALYEP